MISFNNSNEVRKDAAIASYALELGKKNPECEISLTLAHGCVVARIYDDFLGYIFTYPKARSSEASESEALREITEYCLRENIPEIISDTPIEKLPLLLRSVRHAELHAMDESGELFAVEIKTELSMLTGEVNLSLEGIELSLPSQSFASEYESLVRDSEHNKYYGYEITDDNPDISASDMVAEALREFELGRAMTLFVTENGEFVGEAVLYNFDGRGSAEISFRVARDKCGQGYGRKILAALVEIAGQLGLLRLLARVREDNTSSLALLKSSSFNYIKKEDTAEVFMLCLCE